MAAILFPRAFSHGRPAAAVVAPRPVRDRNPARRRFYDHRSRNSGRSPPGASRELSQDEERRRAFCANGGSNARFPPQRLSARCVSERRPSRECAATGETGESKEVLRGKSRPSGSLHDAASDQRKHCAEASCACWLRHRRITERDSAIETLAGQIPTNRVLRAASASRLQKLSGLRRIGTSRRSKPTAASCDNSHASCQRRVREDGVPRVSPKTKSPRI